MIEEDYVMCPSCSSPVAEITTGMGIDFTRCPDCGFKWHMLVEPDPDLFEEMGSETPIVAFEENFFDLEPERQDLILEWSDLGSSSDRGSERTVPHNIYNKRQKFFERYYAEIEKEIEKNNASYIDNYISGKADFTNVLYVLVNVCSMRAIKSKSGETYKIEYYNFNANAYRMNSNIPLDELKKIIEKREQIVMIEKEYIPKKERKVIATYSDYTFNKFFEDINPPKKEENSIHNIVKNSRALNTFLIPSIVKLRDYEKEFEDTYKTFPAMIDLDSEMVYLNISHNSIMESFLEKENIVYKDFDDVEKKFHKRFNMVQYAVSEIAQNRLLTDSEKNLNRVSYIKDVQIVLLNKETENFFVLNGTGKVKGKIYFPKENEELEDSNKILVIPTASEEYFISAVSTIESGCIITERGSKMSHLVSNAKELNFKIILVENAMKLFTDGELVEIDLDSKRIVRED